MKRQKWRRVLSWILTLTMIFSQFAGTGGTLVVHAAEPEAHKDEHSGVSYTPNGAVITFHCNGDNNNTPDDLSDDVPCNADGATLTIGAPASLVYDGNAKTATLTGDAKWTAASLTVPTIKYYLATDTENELEKSITDVGNYVAKITVEDKTASKSFSITQATPVVTVSLEDWTYGEDAKTPSLSGKPSYVDDDKITYEYKEKTATAYPAENADVQPTDAGEYTVKVSIEGTDNYSIESSEDDFVINQAVPVYAVNITPWAVGSYNADTNKPALTATSNAKDIVIAANDITFAYTEQGKDAYSAAVPTTAGKYTVKATVAETTNYKGGNATKDFIISDKYSKPLAPVMKSNSFTSITLEPIEGGEYKCTQFEGETETLVKDWNNSNVFNGLIPGTEYTFYQKIKGNDIYAESDSSEGTKISTKTHVHDWTYKANDNTITATCLDGDGGHVGEKTATLTIAASDTTYTGKAVKATITGTIDGVYKKDGDIAIVYKKGDEVLSEAPKAVGEYTASITIEDATASVAFKITKAAGAEVTEDNKPTANKESETQNLVYSGKPQALVKAAKVELTGYTVVYAVSDNKPTDEKAYSAVIPTRTLPGTYKVWYMFKGDGNHGDITDEFDALSVTIDKKVLTVTAKPKTIIYGDEPSANGVTYDGFVEGEDETVLTGTLDYTYDYKQYDNVDNTYTITPKGYKEEGCNYTFTYVPGTLTVEPLEVELKWETEVEYDDKAVVPKATVSNLVKAGDNVEVTVTTDPASCENVGTGYKAEASTTLGGASAGNYKLSIDNPTKTSTFAIVKKKVTIKADDKNQVYDNDKTNDPELKATVTDSKDKPITTGFAFVRSEDYTLTRVEGQNVGKYTITLEMTDAQKAKYPNLDITLENGTFEITKANATITVKKDGISGLTKVYNKKATLEDLDQTGDVDITGLVEGDELNYTLRRDPGEDVGKYDIQVILGNNPNYNVEVINTNPSDGDKPYQFIITAKDVTVAGITAEAKTYDGTTDAVLDKSKVTIDGKLSGDDLTIDAKVAFASADVNFDGEDKVTAQAVNVTEITLSGNTAKNYNLIARAGQADKTKDTGSAVISQLPITIKADDQTVDAGTDAGFDTKKVLITEGELLKDHSIDSVNLIVEKETETELGKEWTVVTDWTKLSKTDNVRIKAENAVIKHNSDNVTNNYDITYASNNGQYGTLTVVDARAHVATKPVSDNTLKYIAAEQALLKTAGKATTGGKIVYRLEDETEFSDDIPVGVDAKTYKVYYKAVDGAEDETVLGDSDVESVEVTIGKAPLQVSAKNKTITYGDEPSDDGVEYSGWYGSDNESVLKGTLVLTTDYEQNGYVGKYTITPSGQTADNYELEFVPAQLTVEPKELGLSWSEETSFTYDGKAHTLTVEPSGVLEGDEVSLKVTLTGSALSGEGNKEAINAGAYTATAEFDKPNANYKLPAEATKDFTITKADVKITAPVAKELVYNKSEQELVEAGTAGEGLGEWKYVVFTDKTTEPNNTTEWATAVPKKTDAGTYYVWYKFVPADTANYNAVAQTYVAVTIDPKPVIVVAEDKEITYKEAEKTLSAKITDAEGEDWVPANANDIKYTLQREEGLDAGSYPITVTITESSDNYSVTTQDGTYTIKPITGVIVTITGNKNENNTYDGTVKKAEGYDAVADNPDYDVAKDFKYNGTAVVSNNNAGTYMMGLKASDFVNISANFADVKFEVTDGKLVIDKKPVYVSGGITAADKPYDGKTDATLNCDKAVFEGLVAGDVLKINATGTFADANVNGEEGDVVVNITYDSLDGASALNYVLITPEAETNPKRQDTASAKIKKLPINIQVKDQTVVRDSGKDFSEKVDDVTVTGTFVGNQKITSVDLNSENWETNKNEIGTYDLEFVSATVKDGETDYTNNYKFTSQAGTVTVVDPTATVKEAPVSINDLTYTGKTQKLVTEGTANEADAQIVYSKSENGQYSPSIPTEKNAGDYVVYYKAAGTGYNESKAVSINVTIAKAPLTVTASNRTIIYGEDPKELAPEVTYFTFVNGESETQEGVLTGTLTCKYDYVKGGNVGNEYTITPEGLDAANYDIKFVKGTLTVEPKTAELAWDETPLVYTGEEQIPAATVTNLEEGDECEVTVTTLQEEATDAGSYTAVASELSNENYKLPAVKTFSYEIARAKGSIETDPVAAELSYTGEPQELVIAGVANVGDIQYALGASAEAADEPAAAEWSTAIPKATFVGDYYVWYRLPYTANYTGTQAKCVTVTIAKAALVISANAMSVAYGEPKPSVEDCTVSYIGLGANDTADKVFEGIEDYYAFEIDCDEKPDAGEYDIKLTLTKDIELANYVVEAANGTLTVEAKEAALIWDAEEVYPYDGKAHAPSVTIDPESLVYDTDEVAAIVKISTADGKEVTGIPKDAGEYVATVTGLDNSNYKLPEDEDALTRAFVIKGHEGIITKAPVAKEGLVYNATEQALVEAGEVNGGTLEYALSTSYDNEPEEGWSDEVPTGKDAKSYFVWYRLNGGVNYSNVAASPLDPDRDPDKAVIIDKAPLTLKAKDKHVEYGAEEVVFDDSDYTCTGLKGTDKFVNTGFEVSLTTDYVQFGTKDTYNIDLTWAGKSNNYSIAGKELGFVHVDPKSVGIIWGDTEFIYDGKAHVPTATPSRNDIMASTDKVEFVVEVEGGEAKNAGTYWAEVTGLTEESNANYRPKADKKRIQFTIAKATISADKVTEPVAKTGLVYSASAQQLISAGTVSDNLGTYKYALAASENTAEESLTYTDSIPTGTNAGTYYVWYKVSANNAANYNEIAAKKVSVSIDKASISVSYNANEGEGTKASEVFKIGTASDNITVSTNSFTKAGHEFVSWNTAADGSGTGYAEGDTFAPEKIEDITLYAQWKAVTHTVSFNMNGYGDPIDPVVVISGNTVDEPATPSANGVVFDGWYADAECTEEYDFAAPVVEDITLFAKWLQKYTVSFNMNGYGDPIDPVEVVSGDKVTRPATPSANGVVFGGWFTEAECTNEYDFNKTVSDNFTLFAKWTQKFTVSFNMGGHGTQIPSQEVLSGNTAARPADPADPEYTFEDWFTAEDYASVYDFAAPVSANITVYAKWNLTVSLNSISINKAPAKTEYVEGEVFDPAGMEVSANYTDGSSKTVSGYTITPSANLTTSDNKITVSYTEDGITCTADVAIKVKAEKSADVIVEDEDYSVWNLYEDNTEHTFTIAGTSANAVKNSNAKSAAYYDAELNGDTITVTAKGDLKKAAKAANAVLEFVTDDGVVEFALPVEYKKPALKLSVKSVSVKNGAETTVKTTILRKSPAGVFEPMDLTNAAVTFAGKDAEILENGEIGITVNGGVKDVIKVAGEGWVSSDPVELKFAVKGSSKDVVNVEMNGLKTVIVNSNAKGQSFEFPVFVNGEAADDEKVTVEDKKGTGLAKIEGGNLVIAYPEEGTVKKGNYTIALKSGNSKAVKVKVKVSDKALSDAVKLTVKSKYDVVTGQKMVIVPNFKDLGGKLEDVSIEKDGFSAVVNEAGNIVVDYEGSAYNTKNLKMGDLTFKLTVEGVEDEVAVTAKNVKAKKTNVKVTAAKVFVKNGAGTANLVCSYKDSAGNMHLIAPKNVNLDKFKNVTAVVDEDDPTVINITSLTGKSGSVKAIADFGNGYTKAVTIKVKAK